MHSTKHRLVDILGKHCAGAEHRRVSGWHNGSRDST